MARANVLPFQLQVTLTGEVQAPIWRILQVKLLVAPASEGVLLLLPAQHDWLREILHKKLNASPSPIQDAYYVLRKSSLPLTMRISVFSTDD
jgi:hypothetical protein